MKLSEHFDDSEFACPDCGVAIVDPRLVTALEAFRHEAGDRPVTVLSAYRCKADNSHAHGASHSQHMVGKAADVRVAGAGLAEMYAAALRVPAFKNGGVGIYDGNFVHLDVRDGAARWARVWGDYMSIEASKLLPAADEAVPA